MELAALCSVDFWIFNHGYHIIDFIFDFIFDFTPMPVVFVMILSLYATIHDAILRRSDDIDDMERPRLNCLNIVMFA